MRWFLSLLVAFCLCMGAASAMAVEINISQHSYSSGPYTNLTNTAFVNFSESTDEVIFRVGISSGINDLHITITGPESVESIGGLTQNLYTEDETFEGHTDGLSALIAGSTPYPEFSYFKVTFSEDVTFKLAASVVPEPSTIALIGLGLGVIAISRRYSKRRKA